MVDPKLPPIETFPQLPDAEKTHVLDLLFEPSPALHDVALKALQGRSFATYHDLIRPIRSSLVNLSASDDPTERRTLETILSSHPRLGEKKVESVQSQSEQARLRARDGEAEALQRWNERYEKTFPGLRFVTFVNGRGREEILAEMRSRIETSDDSKERYNTIEAMCDIAHDRARKLTADASS